MIIGNIKENEKKIKLNFDIKCTECGKSVPGGIQTSEKYFETKAFKSEIDNFKKNYLCGRCRDKKRVDKGYFNPKIGQMRK